jgi:hypothetical protein
MKWQLLTDWSAGSGAGQHIPVGSVIEGVTDRNGTLTAIRWQGQEFPPALPLEAMALDQAAADQLAKQHPNYLHLLRAAEGNVIRPWSDPLGEADLAEARTAFNTKLTELRQRRGL